VKRANHLFPQIIAFENLLRASSKARRGKRFRRSTALFELNLEKNLFRTIRLLETKTYAPGEYTDFLIHDPKTRRISAAPYRDRVIHHALINVIEPLIGKSFIYDTYACIKGKGTHKAVARYRKFLPKNRFVLKCDIRQYFFSIDHAILREQFRHKIKCRDTLWLVDQIIASKQWPAQAPLEYFAGDDLFTPVSRKKGIPIGNLTSQFFANLYLNDFDHFIKQTLGCRHYIRYCDDFVVFGNDKYQLKDTKQSITEYLATLRLRLHPHKSRVFRTKEGVDFLGYRIYPDFMRVRKNNVKRFRKRLRMMARLYKEGRIGLQDIQSSIHSWIGHVKHADSYGLREEILSSAVFRR
jgi:retron-type reverse transcriptase